MHTLIVFDALAAGLALYAYHSKGFWFYGMLSYVALFMVSIYVSGLITGDLKLYSDHVSVRWLAVDAGLIGYMANDLLWRNRNEKDCEP